MKTKLYFFLMVFCIISINSLAQETGMENDTANAGQNFSLSADFVSSYIWRGLALSNAPNIQPNLAFNKGNFSLGAFGSYSLGESYSEVDLYTGYSLGMFSVELWDYFVMDSLENNHFFDYKKESTGHALEGIISFNGPESFPIKATVGTFFYGADKDSVGDNYYSTYFELAYTFKWKKNNLTAFIGGTPKGGLYASNFAINNIGLTNEREIRFNDKFSLPISGSLIVNPYLENIYLVFTISFGAND